jgi:L-asparaginase II
VTGVVEVTRGALVESHHRVHVVVAHAERGVIASCGNPAHVSFVRSAIKMFQALPLVEDAVDAALGVSDEELALCTASHNAEPFHVAAAHRLLARAGADENALACGAHPPMSAAAAATLHASGIEPGRIHNNCSGKHAGMIALAHVHGWPIDGYHQIDHPVQQRVTKTLSTWTGISPAQIGTAIDGCGLPTFALPLDAVAHACARFATAAVSPGTAATRLVGVMTKYPEYVAGTGRLCTLLMRRTAASSLFAKVGAEGFYCAGVPSMKVGLALKVEDGAKRASEPALLSALRTIDALTDADLEALRDFSRPAVLNTRGEIVGEVRARLPLKVGG